MDQKAPKYMTYFNLMVVILIYFTVNFLSASIYAGFFADTISSITYSKISYIPSFLLIIILASVYRRIVLNKKDSDTKLNFKKSHHDARYVIFGIVYIIFIAIFVEPVQVLIEADRTAYIEQFSSGYIIINVLLTVGMAPVLEEWFFRGIVLKNLSNVYGDVWAILLSALFFAAAHGNMVQLLPALLMGLLFGYIYVKSDRSLTTVIMLHVVNNLISYSLILYGLADNANLLENLLPEKIYTIAYAVSTAFVLLLVIKIVRLRGVNGNSISSQDNK